MLQRYEHDGLVFDVRDSGPQPGPLAGEVAVLLHGWPQTGACFDQVAARLNALGVRTLAPDQRGYSPGARPSGRFAYRLQACTGDVLALLDAAQVARAHVIGHDWGGGVAWALAGHHPQRVHTLVALSTPHPGAMVQALVRSDQGLRSWYMLWFQLPWLPEAMLRAGLERTLVRSGLPPEHAAQYLARLSVPGALSASLNWYRALPVTLRTPTPRVGVPTAYVWGRNDVALGRAAAERTADFALGPYRFVELDAGHWLPETRAEQVAAVTVEQLRAHRGAG